jgi:hypothetical protein
MTRPYRLSKFNARNFLWQHLPLVPTDRMGVSVARALGLCRATASQLLQEPLEVGP